MAGEVLNSQSQMFVIKLLQYFEQEKENGGPLISVLSVQQRVSDALSVSLRTVQNVKKKYNENPILRTPNKSRNKRKRKTIDAWHEVKNLIKSSVYSMYAEKKYLSLSTLQKFLDERHGYEVKQTSGIKRSWQDDSIKSVRKLQTEGKRYIVVHAGTKNGFVPNADLVFSTKKKTAVP
ncbi:hypothetical protein FQA39_LY02332 [Lamprigera yunnana]|nr:hypothetical protein FQA39_LY02332 [Lamprigera yunnana]